MKKRYLSITPVAVFLAIVLIGCPEPSGQTGPAAGDQQIFTADSILFTMVYVPGKTFPTGIDDLGTPATVADAYWIGETEVTYILWNVVYSWATDAARGANIYIFGNAGYIGDGTGDSILHPVTWVNWRDCMVWCNAVTEWYNDKTGTSYSCVYKDAGTPIRDSTNGTQCDAVIPDASAKGFRLLTKNEWELAARWRNDATNTVAGYSNPWFTQGDSASGATADYNDVAATQAVAWYAANSGLSTHIVKTKNTNSLGLYDMSGNVTEWCWDLNDNKRVLGGGSWGYSANNIVLGFWSSNNPDGEMNISGFRLARNP